MPRFFVVTARRERGGGGGLKISMVPGKFKKISSVNG